MKNYLIPAAFLFLFSCGEKKEETKTPEEKTVSEKEYLIAYNIHVPDTTKDDWDIMLMNTDGSNQKNITNNDDVAWTYYIYKNKIYFISDRDTAYRNFFLYEMDTDGKNIRKVSDLRLEDSWMNTRNNGEEMVVTGRIGKETRQQLFIVNTKTGKYTQITNDTAAFYSDPNFSPNGKQIVCFYQKNKRDQSAHEELFVMNADGTNMKQITNYPEDNPSAKEYGYKAGTPHWHPTENFISYVSKQDGKNGIYAVMPDGKKQWKLFESEHSAGWHDWSPDGKWLTFSGSEDDQQFHIYLMNWKTKEIKQLTDTTYHSQLGPVFVEK